MSEALPAVDETLVRTTALLYRNASFGQGVAIVLASLLAYAGYGFRPAAAVAWWAAMVGVSLVRMAMAVRFGKSQRPADPAWRRRGILGATVAGCGWAVGAAIFMWGAPEGLHLFVPFMISGVVAGAVPLLAPVPLAFRLFSIPPVLVVAVCSLLQASSQLHWLVASACVLFLPAMLRTARSFYDVVDESIRLATEQARMAEELRVARDAALAGSQAKSEFLATVSHEIRTPMNGVLGMTSLLQQTPLDNEQREFVGIIKQSADALMNIINDILDYSRLDAGQLGIHAEPFLRDDLLQSMSALMEPRAQEKGLGFGVAVAPDVPPQVVGDAGRLRQVLVNLAGNAVKFTDRGEVRVAVTAVPARLAGNEAKIRFEIRDTGIGIPRDKRDMLFQPFSQVDGSSTRRHGGTGLGLAISRRLVELMGGEIGFDSEEGRGSTFWFTVTLPLPEEGVIS